MTTEIRPIKSHSIRRSWIWGELQNSFCERVDSPQQSSTPLPPPTPFVYWIYRRKSAEPSARVGWLISWSSWDCKMSYLQAGAFSWRGPFSGLHTLWRSLGHGGGRQPGWLLLYTRLYAVFIASDEVPEAVRVWIHHGDKTRAWGQKRVQEESVK